MRGLLAIGTLVCSLSPYPALAQEFELPIPTAAEWKTIEEMETPFGSMLERYLIKNFGPGSELDSVEMSIHEERPISYYRKFSKGITFSTKSMAEVATFETIIFPTKNLKMVVELIKSMPYGDDNIWQTPIDFVPADGGVGCEYHIRLKENKVVLYTHCGC